MFGATFSLAATAAQARSDQIGFTKTADKTGFIAAGERIAYTYRLVNGPVALTGVSVVDDQLGPIACPATDLPPGGSMACAAEYTTTDADVAARVIVNTATVTAVAPTGRPVGATADASVPYAGEVAFPSERVFPILSFGPIPLPIPVGSLNRPRLASIFVVSGVTYTTTCAEGCPGTPTTAIAPWAVVAPGPALRPSEADRL